MTTPSIFRPVVGLSALALTAVLLVGQVAGQTVDAKGDKELTSLSRKIDKTAAASDAGRVTDGIVDEWKGTVFTFDAGSTARPLTAQDVQNLRAKGLGFGEISILLALTAKQPDPSTAKSVSDILGMRKPGEGWGKIARDLGYKNLGSVIRSVKATERSVTQVARAEQAGKVQKADRPEKPEKPEKPAKPERPGR